MVTMGRNEPLVMSSDSSVTDVGFGIAVRIVVHAGALIAIHRDMRIVNPTIRPGDVLPRRERNRGDHAR